MKFEDFGKIGQKKQTGPGVPVEGTFGCQHCEAILFEAQYHPEQSLIVWTCPDRHVSSMEWKI